MLRFAFITAFALVFSTQGSFAEIITNKEKCNSHLKIIEEMNEEIDVGPKIEAVVADLTAILKGYCDSGNFNNADEVANAIRGLLATEHSGG